jgi:glycosyltransferase 2 family protein
MFVVALAIAAALLFYSLRGIDWHEVGRILGGASLPLVAAVIVLTSASLYLRACRWRVLLNSTLSIGVARTFWATAAGYFGNNVLPARGGELVRTYMIASRPGELAFVLTTALAERVADALALVTIASIVLLVHPVASGWMSGAARPVAFAAMAAVLIIAIVPLFGAVFERLIARLPLPARVKYLLHHAVEPGMEGLRAFHDVGRLSEFLALTAVIWTIDAIATVVGGTAIGLHLSLMVAFLLLAGLGLGSALPSTPGYVGIYQFVAVSVLTPFGFSRTQAIAYILLAQALSYIVMGFWGAVAFWRYRRDRARAAPPSIP